MYRIYTLPLSKYCALVARRRALLAGMIVCVFAWWSWRSEEEPYLVSVSLHANSPIFPGYLIYYNPCFLSLPLLISRFVSWRMVFMGLTVVACYGLIA
ncbi:hypothetical protein BDV29DRAFT_14462 [Aspergillus leporis]|jgi:hypothetical protein|uniref:Uncharacterized protein n=1 Tax=Aspergillus leporis TaxID=41062 RepID=A0A5N5XBZ0_9EURO|nr:hypothetical protein BDV29DRAFT_14462 [Aspergillus leporis]